MKALFLAEFLLLIALVLPAHAASPIVSNVRAIQRPGTHLVDIRYNVNDPDGPAPLTISVAISDNSGQTYQVPVFTLTGAVGTGVHPGNDLLMTWNAGLDWAGHFSDQCRVRILADDNSAPPAPRNMAYIPGGVFAMGDTFSEDITAMPVHTVYLSPFFMDKFEVSRELWLEVLAWSRANGYGNQISGGGDFKSIGLPAHSMNWFNAVKWCNARSEMEGLTPCYYTDYNHTVVYRNETISIVNSNVNWSANGYRLPTEAEWEKAARGGHSGQRFPFGDTISHNQANYRSNSSYAFDVSPTRGYHPDYSALLSPLGSFPPNGYGLYDMAGNVSEWCWDWYDDAYYGRSAAKADDSHGPSDVTLSRLVRGGAWANEAPMVQVSWRFGFNQTNPEAVIGFRCVRGIR